MKKSLYLLVLFAFLLFISSCGDDEPSGGPDPVAAFSVDNSTPNIGDAITFTNSSTNAESYNWDFGDGSSSTLENPTYTYNQSGTFTVTLTAISAGGAESSTSEELTVTAFTGPTPTASFSIDKAFAEVGDQIIFTNSSVDGSTFEWDFGDGSTSTDENPTHNYSAKGTYTVTLTAIGSGGIRRESTNEITVGSRVVVGFILNKIDLKNDEGQDWDNDGTPPDIVFLYTDDPESGSNLLILNQDLALDELPLGVNIGENFFELSDEEWIFGLLDNDAPFDDFGEEATEVMFAIAVNPTTVGEVDYAQGFGSFIIADSEQRFEVEIVFEIRP